MDVKKNIEKLGPVKWKIPRGFRKEMRADCIVYGNDYVMEQVEDDALMQLTNVACLPGVVAPVIGAPDIHFGYGLPMGAVGAFDKEEGVISSGCTGFDINCGIHMIKTNLEADEVRKRIRILIDVLFRNVPCGVGAKGKLRVSREQLDEILTNGARWAMENDYATEEDLERMEENGCMEGADPSKVSDSAMKRGLPQLGTLGAGNHFLEVQAVDEIYDEKIAKAFGIDKKGQTIVMLHCGSRGLGHQVASDYLKIHEDAARKYKIWLPDNQLVCAPANSKEGQDYFAAMKCAVNYAFTNRAVMTAWIRQSFEEVFDMDWEEMDMKTVYDVCHNICKLEKHKVDGKTRELYVHRKGSTRALPAGHPMNPEAYMKTGHPVLIAGSMGTASYILVGSDKSAESFYSTCHGAGRVMSRNEALRTFRGTEVQRKLEATGKAVRSTHPSVLSEEAPEVYKNIDEVIESVHQAGISLKVARLVPLGVAKG